MFFIKIYIKESYMNCYHTSIQMCGQYCILAPLNGWKKVEHDEVPNHGSFTDFDGLNFSTESHNPEDFFNQLFDKSMYTRMPQETNSYAHDKIRKVLQGRDPFEQMDHHTNRQHA